MSVFKGNPILKTAHALTPHAVGEGIVVPVLHITEAVMKSPDAFFHQKQKRIGIGQLEDS